MDNLVFPKWNTMGYSTRDTRVYPFPDIVVYPARDRRRAEKGRVAAARPWMYGPLSSAQPLDHPARGLGSSKVRPSRGRSRRVGRL